MTCAGERDPLDAGIGLGARGGQVAADAGDVEDATSVGDEAAVAQGGAGVEDERARGLRLGDAGDLGEKN